jgi:catechol 2,3-dioxygenase-like lactoylglutathione lyase family enzyme
MLRGRRWLSLPQPPRAIIFGGTRKEEKMTIELNHTIVPARDKRASAKFLADILGLEAGPEWSHFVPVRTSNGVTLDYADATDFRRQHYAFLVSEQEFDAALSRIKEAGATFYADFNRDGRGQINHLYGGRGFYFDDPDGHLMEIITRPTARLPNDGPNRGPDKGPIHNADWLAFTASGLAGKARAPEWRSRSLSLRH